jgi:hypothetical protein
MVGGKGRSAAQRVGSFFELFDVSVAARRLELLEQLERLRPREFSLLPRIEDFEVGAAEVFANVGEAGAFHTFGWRVLVLGDERRAIRVAERIENDLDVAEAGGEYAAHGLQLVSGAREALAMQISERGVIVIAIAERVQDRPVEEEPVQLGLQARPPERGLQFLQRFAFNCGRAAQRLRSLSQIANLKRALQVRELVLEALLQVVGRLIELLAEQLLRLLDHVEDRFPDRAALAERLRLRQLLGRAVGSRGLIRCLAVGGSRVAGLAVGLVRARFCVRFYTRFCVWFGTRAGARGRLRITDLSLDLAICCLASCLVGRCRFRRLAREILVLGFERMFGGDKLFGEGVGQRRHELRRGLGSLRRGGGNAGGLRLNRLRDRERALRYACRNFGLRLRLFDRDLHCVLRLVGKHRPLHDGGVRRDAVTVQAARIGHRRLDRRRRDAGGLQHGVRPAQRRVAQRQAQAVGIARKRRQPGIAARLDGAQRGRRLGVQRSAPPARGRVEPRPRCLALRRQLGPPVASHPREHPPSPAGKLVDAGQRLGFGLLDGVTTLAPAGRGGVPHRDRRLAAPQLFRPRRGPIVVSRQLLRFARPHSLEFWVTLKQQLGHVRHALAA